MQRLSQKRLRIAPRILELWVLVQSGRRRSLFETRRCNEIILTLAYLALRRRLARVFPEFRPEALCLLTSPRAKSV
jgi:hypothetical protein